MWQFLWDFGFYVITQWPIRKFLFMLLVEKYLKFWLLIENHSYRPPPLPKYGRLLNFRKTLLIIRVGPINNELTIKVLARSDFNCSIVCHASRQKWSSMAKLDKAKVKSKVVYTKHQIGPCVEFIMFVIMNIIQSWNSFYILLAANKNGNEMLSLEKCWKLMTGRWVYRGECTFLQQLSISCALPYCCFLLIKQNDGVYA